MATHQLEDPDRLRSLIDAILTIERDADLSSLLEVIVSQATSLVGARYGALGVLSEDGDQLSEFITAGLTVEERTAIGHFPVGKGLLHRVILDPEPLRVDDLEREPDRAGFPKNHPPMKSFLGVPVRLEGDDVYGNLYLCDKLDGTPFDAADEEVVSTLGRAAGLLIDKVRLRQQLRDLTLAEERERMARNLHDDVIQRLFAVGLSLQSVVSSDVPESAQKRINQSIDDLDETIRQIRTTIFAISRPASADAMSLRRQILKLCDEAAGRLGVDVAESLTGPLDEEVGRHAEEQLLAALREALTNVVRHAHASRAEVIVRVDGAGITLTVLDDGVGFAPDPSASGRGLRNLSERAMQLGGYCEVTQRDEGGTELVWRAARIR